jgi:hypothetical protein
MSEHLVPPIRDLFSEHPRASRCPAEQVAGLLWVLRLVLERPEPFEVADALEVLDVERGMAA